MTPPKSTFTCSKCHHSLPRSAFRNRPLRLGRITPEVYAVCRTCQDHSGWRPRRDCRFVVHQRFGRWVAVHSGPERRWWCRCDCGTERYVRARSLLSGESKSCGCGQREVTSARSKTHGLTRTREYRIWAHMKRRCLDPSDDAYKNYGERGITICERWQSSFEAFLEDMGAIPGPDYSLDRIDNDGPYAPANCRWATRMQQAQNMRKSRILTFHGKTLCVSEWARRVGIAPETLRSRLRLGWSVERTLTEPAHPSRWSNVAK